MFVYQVLYVFNSYREQDSHGWARRHYESGLDQVDIKTPLGQLSRFDNAPHNADVFNIVVIRRPW